LAVGAELDDHTSFVLFAGKLFEIIGGRGTRVGHPNIAVFINMDTMRPREHAAAKAPDLLARLVEMVNRVRLGTETTRHGPRRTPIRCPYCLAVAIDSNAVGAAPRSSLDVRPIPDHPVGIGAAVDRLNFVGLWSASARLRLQFAFVQRNPGDDDRHGHPESPAT